MSNRQGLGELKVMVVLMSEWEKKILGDVCDIKHGYAFKGEYFSDVPNGYYLVTPGNFNIGGGFKEGKPKYYTGEFPADYILFEGDLIVTMTDLSQAGDTLGYSALVPKNSKQKYLHNQRIGKVIVDDDIADKNFIHWLMRTGNYQDFIVGAATGSTVKHTSPTTINSYTFLLPPLSTQRAIAEILSSLDDKIGLLARQNVTLEDLAQTYFRQWFTEGTNEDWEEKNLGDFFPVVTGKRDANFSTDDGQYPFFTCSQTTLAAPNYSFEGNAILLAGNGDFNIKRYRGKFEAYQRTYVLIPYEAKYHNWLYLLMSIKLGDITSGHHGSVINYLTKDMITDFSFPFPDNDITSELSVIDCLFSRIDANTQQILTLQKLRNTLLPKLISGEVGVKQ